MQRSRFAQICFAAAALRTDMFCSGRKATVVSHIHSRMPLRDDRIVEAAREALTKIKKQMVAELTDEHEEWSLYS